jgi:hypothetical protein
MEQNPSREANDCPGNEEHPCLSWNPNVHYCVHKSLPLFPVLSQLNPHYTLPHYFSKIHYNIILPSMPQSSKWPLPLGFLDQNFVLI